VVLSCFLDEEVEVHTYDLSIHRGPLEYVGGDYCGIEVGGSVGHYYFEECKDNPILIPAKTVAEVWKAADPVKLSALAAATGGRCDNPFPMFDWLTTHTKEDT